MNVPLIPPVSPVPIDPAPTNPVLGMIAPVVEPGNNGGGDITGGCTNPFVGNSIPVTGLKMPMPG